jgi:hypothetical protein
MAFAMALYSASVLDLDTIGCFRAHHETRLPPINTAKPPVERQSSGSPAQSKSEKELTNIDEDFVIFSPYLSVFDISQDVFYCCPIISSWCM